MNLVLVASEMNNLSLKWFSCSAIWSWALSWMEGFVWRKSPVFRALINSAVSYQSKLSNSIYRIWRLVYCSAFLTSVATQVVAILSMFVRLINEHFRSNKTCLRTIESSSPRSLKPDSVGLITNHQKSFRSGIFVRHVINRLRHAHERTNLKAFNLKALIYFPWMNAHNTRR